MPSSPIAKKITLPDNWVHLQKTMIPDSTTASYWSVWYDPLQNSKGKAWLMWCPIDDDPSVNDSWGHAEELCGDVKKVITAIEAIYGVSFHESIWEEIPSE